MFSVEDKVVAVTGGASGIGACIVREFLNEGAKYVAILDVNENTGKMFEKELILRKYGNKIDFFKCDVTNYDQVDSIFEEIAKKFGTIDIVVNNAGISNETMSGYKKEIDINVIALISSTSKAIELMREDRGGKGGTVINVSSVAALIQVSPTAFVYAGTKSAVLYFSTCIGEEHTLHMIESSVPKYTAFRLRHSAIQGCIGVFDSIQKITKENYQQTKVRILTICFGITSTSLLINYDSFDQDIISKYKSIEVSKVVMDNGMCQTAEAAAVGVIQSYRNGKSGSTWMINESEAHDITDLVHEAYNVMSDKLRHSK